MRGFGPLLCPAYTKAADRRTVRAVERTRRAVLLRITANKTLQTITTACVLRRPLLLSKVLYNFSPLWYSVYTHSGAVGRYGKPSVSGALRDDKGMTQKAGFRACLLY